MNHVAEQVSHKVDVHTMEHVAEALKLKVDLRDKEILRLKSLLQSAEAISTDRKRTLEAKDKIIEILRRDAQRALHPQIKVTAIHASLPDNPNDPALD